MTKDMDVETATQISAVAFARDLMVSNLGQMPYESEFGKFRLEAVWGPTALQGLDGEQNVGIATTNGTIRLLHASYPLISDLLENTDSKYSKTAVLNSLTSVDGQRGYGHAIDEFVDWYWSAPRLALNRTVVLRYRSYLEGRQLAPGTINPRPGAVRRLTCRNQSRPVIFLLPPTPDISVRE